MIHTTFPFKKWNNYLNFDHKPVRASTTVILQQILDPEICDFVISNNATTPSIARQKTVTK